VKLKMKQSEMADIEGLIEQLRECESENERLRDLVEEKIGDIDELKASNKDLLKSLAEKVWERAQ
jgi:hypothetical protein